MSRSRTLGLLLAPALLTPLVGAPVSAAAADPAPAAAREPRSLVIGIDGATLARMADADLPAIERLQRAGTTSPSHLYAEPMAPTLSGPGWSSIATGVWPDRHRVTDNAFTGARFDRWPDYLTRLERARPGTSTSATATWAPIVETVFGDDVDRRVAGSDDADTTRRVVASLAGDGPDSAFVQLDEVDGAGHGSGTDSEAYLRALEAADARIGRILDAVESRPTYDQERWLVVLTADHGHTPSGGHGGSSLAERSTFVIARGGDPVAAAARRSVEVVDVAATVLAHHGVATPRGIDGVPLGRLRADAFDALRPRLRAAVDEAPGPRGWTRAAPDGWRVDNSRMPAGGVTEWRGWSFATDEFWSSVDPGQGRETAVRSRGVLAVADSDEWDDAPHADGAFDSTLVSPAWRVAGSSRAQVRFASRYAIDGPQSARVLVSFDGGPAREVTRYAAEHNRVQSLDVRVPAGAQRMRVRFRYTGENSAFWALDQVAVRR